MTGGAFGVIDCFAGSSGKKQPWADCGKKEKDERPRSLSSMWGRLPTCDRLLANVPIGQFELQRLSEANYRALESSSAKALCGPPGGRLVVLFLWRRGGRWSTTGVAVGWTVLAGGVTWVDVGLCPWLGP